MKSKIIFIHGMFLNGKSWGKWIPKFEELGYECEAPTWPLPDEEVLSPLLMGDAVSEPSLNAMIDYYAQLAENTEARPILIGHSLGGLIAQILVSRGLGAAAVCISSVAPNAMLSVDCGFFKNTTPIGDRPNGDPLFQISREDFHRNFCNMMSRAESDLAYRRYVVPESRNVLRDTMGRAGHIELYQSHEPLLFISGEKDLIIPPSLNRKNAEAYSDKTSVTNFKLFPRRGHFICGETGWEEVADYTAEWLAQAVAIHNYESSLSGY